MRITLFSLVALLILMLSGCKKDETTPEIVTPKKWHVLSSQPNVFLSTVSFLNSNIGFAVGSYVDNEGLFLHGMIYKTTDEGLNWVITSPDTLHDLCTVFFTDTLTGYAAGTNCIIKTINGGKDWITILEDTEIHLISMYFPDKNTGFAVGLFGEILKTTNAGESWEYQQSETRCHLTSVWFTDNQTGYIVGYWNQDPDLYGIMLKTKDGGATWDSIPLPARYTPASITFTTPTVGYITGGNSVLKTTDAGRNWEIIFTNPYGGLQSASFIRNSPSGFVVGQNGAIFKTVDAGVNWSRMEGATTHSLNSVFMVNYDLAYALAFDSQLKMSTVLKWK